MKLFENQETMIKSPNLIRPQFSCLLNGDNNGCLPCKARVKIKYKFLNELNNK